MRSRRLDSACHATQSCPEAMEERGTALWCCPTQGRRQRDGRPRRGVALGDEALRKSRGLPRPRDGEAWPARTSMWTGVARTSRSAGAWCQSPDSSPLTLETVRSGWRNVPALRRRTQAATRSCPVAQTPGVHHRGPPAARLAAASWSARASSGCAGRPLRPSAELRILGEGSGVGHYIGKSAPEAPVSTHLDRDRS